MTEPTKAPRNKGGRPRFHPSDEQRDLVRKHAENGLPHRLIARKVKWPTTGKPIDEDTLRKHFRYELDDALDEVNADVAGFLLDQCRAGNITAIIWHQKTMGGKRDTQRHEHGGIDGKPIELKDMSRYSDAELDAIERASNILIGIDPGAAEES